MRKIIKNIDVLKQTSVPERDVSEARKTIQKLENVLRENDIGIGLSAIQIGIPKQIFVIKNKQKDGEMDFNHFINPEVVDCEGEFVFPNEGCLSFPGLYLNAKRFYHYTLKNRVIDKNNYREETVYFYYPEGNDERIKRDDAIGSIAVQHEMDHLSGKVLPEFGFKSDPITANTKIGRNDPCPCGSGKKYKKCCGKN